MWRAPQAHILPQFNVLLTFWDKSQPIVVFSRSPKTGGSKTKVIGIRTFFNSLNEKNSFKRPKAATTDIGLKNVF